MDVFLLIVYIKLHVNPHTLAIIRVKQFYSYTVLGFTWAWGETGGDSCPEPKEAFLVIDACLSLAVLWLAGREFVTVPFLSTSLAVLGNFDWETAVPYIWNGNLKRYIQHTYVTQFWKTNWIVTVCISRNPNLKYWNHCGFLVLDCSHAGYIV